MALWEAVDVLAADWSRLIKLLDIRSRRTLEDLVTDLDAAPDERTRVAVARQILDLFASELPHYSIVKSALHAQDSTRWSMGVRPGREIQIARLVGLTFPGGARRKPSAEKVILAAASISVRSVRRGGGDPDQPGLIRLRRKDGSVSLPRFQFTRDGSPRNLVLRINQLLGADADPWGVADWWLCPNVWLSGTPADLIDRLDDRTLVAAAVAAVEG